MKKLAIYFTLFSVFLLFETCKKYPEGGYENRGPKTILGSWYLDLYQVNGIDSTNLIDFNNDSEDKYKKVYFLAGSKYSGNITSQTYPITSITIKFRDDNKRLEFHITSDSVLIGSTCYSKYYTGCYRLFFTPECSSTKWEIRKLTKKECFLECTLVNHYYIKLKCKD